MNGIIDVSKGRFTPANTVFGGGFEIFQKLEDLLKKSNFGFLECLVIGPGVEETYRPSANFPEHYTRTYQVYELVNALRNSGIEDFSIDVIDINPRVLDEFRKTPTEIKVRRQFYYNHLIRVDERRATQYYESFFPDCTILKEYFEKVVRVPEDVTSKIRLHQGDIVVDNIVPNSYDIGICTGALSFYSSEATHNHNDPVPQIMEKIGNSIRPRGFLITSEFGGLKTWELRGLNLNYSGTIHERSVGLIQKP